jgi:F-type H+-transporting ATPase subunit delta
MAAGSVAGVYAQALLELSDERGNRVAMVESCRGLLGASAQTALLTRTLVNQLDDPRLGKAKAKAALKAGLAGKTEPELLNLLCLLIDRNRLADAPAILGEIVRLEDLRVGRVLVDVVSATTLSATSQATVESGIKRVLGPGAELRSSVDPELIGGMTVRVGDVYLDGSIRRKLIDMKSRILDTQLSEKLWSEKE